MDRPVARPTVVRMSEQTPQAAATTEIPSSPDRTGAPLDPATPVRLRGVIDALPAYTPGRPAARRGMTAYKISSNENPFPPLPSVLDVLRSAAETVNRYPDMAVTALTDALAERLDVPAARIATGPGSVGVLGQLVAATCDPGDEVVFGWPSFEAYPVLAQQLGAAMVQVPLVDERYDLDAMADAITDRTRMVFVCNPNNPTGTIVGAAAERFLERVPGDLLVVFDEAYREFVTAPDYPDGLELLADHANVAVLRTFSKAYGLAALRVGYAVAHEPVAAALRKAAIPFGVNALAQEAAVASLAAADELEVRVEENGRRARAGRRGAARAGLGRPRPAGQLRLVRPRRRHRRLRRRLPGGGAHRPAVRLRRRARHDRRARGQRPPRRGRRRLPRLPRERLTRRFASRTDRSVAEPLPRGPGR